MLSPREESEHQIAANYPMESAIQNILRAESIPVSGCIGSTEFDSERKETPMDVGDRVDLPHSPSYLSSGSDDIHIQIDEPSISCSLDMLSKDRLVDEMHMRVDEWAERGSGFRSFMASSRHIDSVEYGDSRDSVASFDGWSMNDIPSSPVDIRGSFGNRDFPRNKGNKAKNGGSNSSGKLSKTCAKWIWMILGAVGLIAIVFAVYISTSPALKDRRDAFFNRDSDSVSEFSSIRISDLESNLRSAAEELKTSAELVESRGKEIKSLTELVASFESQVKKLHGDNDQQRTAQTALELRITNLKGDNEEQRISQTALELKITKLDDEKRHLRGDFELRTKKLQESQKPKLHHDAVRFGNVPAGMFAGIGVGIVFTVLIIAAFVAIRKLSSYSTSGTKQKIFYY